jgi:phosphorylcholine metabolism protein LicD
MSLTRYCPLPPDRHDGKFLYQLLKKWMGDDWIFSKGDKRFCRKVKLLRHKQKKNFTVLTQLIPRTHEIKKRENESSLKVHEST